MAAVADSGFTDIPSLVARHAREAPERIALCDDTRALRYGELDRAMDRVAAALQRDGVQAGETVATCAAASVAHATVFLGALRAGVAVAPLAPGVAPESFARMLADTQAKRLFLDCTAAGAAGGAADTSGGPGCAPRTALDDPAAVERWLAPEGARPQPVAITPDLPFNIIYSSGTTGEPKGIVQPHRMRWAHVSRGAKYGYGPGSVTLLATPLYSNTTLVVFFPTLAFGGSVVLMPKFDAARYLRLAQAHRATHTMLVPVQYQRLMALPTFDAHDLGSFRFKFCTSAPFPAALKADVLRRWPGGLVEFYGMTEGGGTCILEAHLHPDKLHTVGTPAEGHDIRLVDDEGRELPPGATGEVVGHSPGMMTGYHRRAGATRDAEWFDAEGRRFIRTGDIGRFDADGYLVLVDRKKDMIISGGFNLYPSDLEAVLREHPAVAEVAVVGVASPRWGETPVAFVVPRPGAGLSAQALKQALKDWHDARAGKTQRLADLRFVDELPRSAIGKVLKHALRAAYEASPSRRDR